MSKKRIPNMGQNRPDDFQTPTSGLDSLYPHIAHLKRIWEPACGKGNIVRALQSAWHDVVATDILCGVDFLTCDVPSGVECIVTNPPFSIKNEWIERSTALSIPFALLMPLTALETNSRQKQWARGVEIVFPKGRIHFDTPSGEGSGSWFYTCWYTWGLNIGQVLAFNVEKSPEQFSLFGG